MNESDSLADVWRRRRRRRIAAAVGVVLVVALAGWAASRVFGWDERPITEVWVEGPDRLVVLGHCHHVARVAVDTGDDVVELRLQTRGPPRGDCLTGVDVALDEPLGDRLLLDVATGRSPPICRAQGC